MLRLIMPNIKGAMLSLRTYSRYVLSSLWLRETTDYRCLWLNLGLIMPVAVLTSLGTSLFDDVISFISGPSPDAILKATLKDPLPPCDRLSLR